MLSLIVLLTLRLGVKFSIRDVAILAVAMATLTQFRFYLFYMVVAAIAGAFTVGMRQFTAVSFLRQLLIIAACGVGTDLSGNHTNSELAVRLLRRFVCRATKPT